MLWLRPFPYDWSSMLPNLASITSQLPAAWGSYTTWMTVRWGSSGLLPCSPTDILFPELLKSWVSRTFLSFFFTPIVYIFLFVDNNLMCLETASSAYVPLGIIVILLQMVWSISFFSKWATNSKSFCHISLLICKVHLRWLQSFFH